MRPTHSRRCASTSSGLQLERLARLSGQRAIREHGGPTGDWRNTEQTRIQRQARGITETVWSTYAHGETQLAIRRERGGHSGGCLPGSRNQPIEVDRAWAAPGSAAAPARRHARAACHVPPSSQKALAGPGCQTRRKGRRHGRGHRRGEARACGEGAQGSAVGNTEAEGGEGGSWYGSGLGSGAAPSEREIIHSSKPLRVPMMTPSGLILRSIVRRLRLLYQATAAGAAGVAACLPCARHRSA